MWGVVLFEEAWGALGLGFGVSRRCPRGDFDIEDGLDIFLGDGAWAEDFGVIGVGDIEDGGFDADVGIAAVEDDGNFIAEGFLYVAGLGGADVAEGVSTWGG